MSKTHTVKQGEYLSQIAARHGFTDWRRIYEHPDNAEFRKMRPNPNILYPGDVIVIPDLKPISYHGETRRVHRIVVNGPPPDELIVVLMHNWDALVTEDCTVEFFGANEELLQTRGATTSATGELRVPIPRGATHARVGVSNWPELDWYFAIGHLDPVRDKHLPFDAANCKITGIQSRLNNLGFSCGEVDGDLGPKTKSAIESFQREVMGRGDADGALDEETCDSLEAKHAC